MRKTFSLKSLIIFLLLCSIFCFMVACDSLNNGLGIGGGNSGGGEGQQSPTEGLAFKLNIEETGYIVTGKGTTEETDIIIPSTHQNLPVVAIGEGAFNSCISLTSIVLPNSVTSIGSRVFYDCKSLTIYCEAENKPSGWSSGWNYSNRPVVWGYSGNEQ